MKIPVRLARMRSRWFLSWTELPYFLLADIHDKVFRYAYTDSNSDTHRYTYADVSAKRSDSTPTPTPTPSFSTIKWETNVTSGYLAKSENYGYTGNYKNYTPFGFHRDSTFTHGGTSYKIVSVRWKDSDDRVRILFDQMSEAVGTRKSETGFGHIHY